MLAQYQLEGLPIYLVGSFDTGITVYSQQVRALNLIWSLLATGTVSTRKGGDRKRIAVVGGGFAGMTSAAGLVRKGAHADITVFERQDTLLPLQQGSDSRWLHPHIYDWPMAGSESNSATVPVLNWTASRASDVVVQALDEWASLLASPPEESAAAAERVRVFCNTQHLQVAASADRVSVEWVGDRREPAEPSIPRGRAPAQGNSEVFDHVILAVGFGLERNTRMSYWRNETYAQPHLGQARTTYILSGAGDGALIDLFRLRISQFRQDRILSDLFGGSPGLVRELRALCENEQVQSQLYERLDALWAREDMGMETRSVQKALGSRLRHDTHVILQLRNDPSFPARLNGARRISFQNRVLAFLLFKSGGFFPSVSNVEELQKEHAVPDDRVINRHGTRVVDGLQAVLAPTLHSQIQEAFEDGARLRQGDDIMWPAAYFQTFEDADDQLKARWRKEYLPSPTESIAAAFCATVAGFLESHHQGSRLRVTLHRTLVTAHETVLQQCCQYQGTGIDRSDTAGRTFPISNATIGAAYTTHRIVRSKSDVAHDELDKEMERRNLNVASRSMRNDVVSVAAIPFLHDHSLDEDAGLNGRDGDRLDRKTVVAVLYLDSDQGGFFGDDALWKGLIAMCSAFVETISRQRPTVAGRIANTAFWTGRPGAVPAAGTAAPVSDRASTALVEVGELEPPCAPRLGYFNYDFSDFAPIEEAHP